WVRERTALRWRNLGEGRKLCRPDLGFIEALFADRHVLWRMGVGGHVADSQMIIAKNLCAALLLDHVVLADGAPADNRFFVAPRRVGKDPARAGRALEPLVVDEAVDLFQDRLQLLGECEIILESLLLRVDLKDHGEHWPAPLYGVGANVVTRACPAIRNLHSASKFPREVSADAAA